MQDGLLIEIEVLKAQLDKAREREKAVTQRLKTEQDRVTLETEDLRSQLEKSKEREKQQICRLENEKVNVIQPLLRKKWSLIDVLQYNIVMFQLKLFIFLVIPAELAYTKH